MIDAGEASLGGIHCLRPGPKTLQRFRALYMAHAVGEHDQLLHVARAIFDADGRVIVDTVTSYEADGDAYQAGMLLRREVKRGRANDGCEAHLEILQEAVTEFTAAFPGAGAHVACGQPSPARETSRRGASDA